MNEQEKIISKIKKLLAMTEANGCSSEEAAVAIAHAQLLMAKYDVELTELSEEEKVIIEDKFSMGTKSVSSYQRLLACSLAPHFAVRVIICTRGDRSQIMNIVGDKIRAAIFKETYLFAYKAFQQQWQAYYKTLSKSEITDIGDIRGSYLKGFVDGITNELQRSENENAIVLKENPEIKDYISEHFPCLINERLLIKGLRHGQAFDQGYEDGSFAQRNKNKSIQEMEERV